MKKEFLVSAREMKQYDFNTIEKIGISSAVLMERAAYSVAMEAKNFLSDKKDPVVLVICGNGNNGADGVCAGRILAEFGIRAELCMLSDERPWGEMVQKQLDIASKYSLPVVTENEISFERYDLILDGIFGIGLNREISGNIKKLIGRINDSGIPVISIDIPSGIDATTGKVLGCVIKATATVTFGFYKCGQFLYPGRAFSGKLIKAKIAINETAFLGKQPSMYTYLPTEQSVTLDRLRKADGNKSTFGKVLVIAGRSTTTGAAILCSKSALRSGCGMVAVITETQNKNALMEHIPESMVETYTKEETDVNLTVKLKKWLDWADVLVIGCGIGQDDISRRIMSIVLKESAIPMVFDADALQLFAAEKELKNLLCAYAKRNNTKKHMVVFTPHPGELASLAGCSIKEVKEERDIIIQKVLDEYPVTLIAKDADTLVCNKNADTYLNITGNDGLSTAGSGDVLAGLCGSLLAQALKKGTNPYDAVCESVYYQGKAADELAVLNGKSFLVASDLIEAYKYILK